jgi:hypothetical protein
MNFSGLLKKLIKGISLLLLIFILFNCSLPPDVPVTKEALDNTRLYSTFVIEESPDALIHVLNKNGEAVVRANYRNIPVYLKIYATSRGLIWYVYPRE